MRRQLVVTGAAITTAVAVAVALPAFAAHEVPDEFPGEVICEDFEGLESLDGVEFEEPPTLIDETEFEEIFPPEDYDVPIIAVIVQGEEGANVYFEPPFHNLTAPEGKEIFFIDICSEKEESPPPTDEPSQPPTHEPTKTPAPVPTDVPAGANAGDAVSLGLWGLFAAGIAAVAGAAMLARRRFQNDA